jgi:hypothetical protein
MPVMFDFGEKKQLRRKALKKMLSNQLSPKDESEFESLTVKS